MRIALVPLLVVALSIGCSEEEEAADVIARETFIATWVDLRSAASRTRTGALPAPERTRVLEEHGVTEDDLLAFVDAYGNDPRYMVDLWAEVEERLQPEPPTDTTETAGG